MRYHPKDIARALVDVARDPENKNLGVEIDEAVRLLRLHNPGKSLRSFPTLVERVLRKAGMDVTAVLITPTGDAGTVAKGIEKELQKIYHQKNVHLTQQADKDMIGGAVLIVNDERFDISVPGALNRLRDYLKESPLQLSSH
ncbi:MAG TPA: F0F1 ATP synthase subunit delta [Candidatus Peribacteraceae bacterium]|nr:F0F1 ATP synthase subunit delta [Candidatus Peribacteraceae bacterium]